MQQPPQGGGPTPATGYTPPPPALRRDVSPAPSSGGGGINLPVVIAIGVVVILVALLLVAGLAKLGPFSSSTSKQSAWTAVFLTDNEVFFGHITVNDNEHMVLQNVYYLQKPASGQAASNTPASINSLVTNQLQCPTDEINIKASNILYWETLQSSSYVVSRLSQIQSTQNNSQCPQPQASSAATPAPSAAPPTAPTPATRAN